MEEIEKLKEELANITRELKIENLARLKAYKNKHYCYLGDYAELYVKQKKYVKQIKPTPIKALVLEIVVFIILGPYRLWLITSRKRNWLHQGSTPCGPTTKK
jgi:hypothetical protein